MVHRILIAVAATFAVVSSASGHITLETQEAPVGASYKAIMQVLHGCAGSATTSIRVRVPEGIIAVKPKPGWKLETVSGRYPHSFSTNGVKANEGITELRWSGGNLPNAYYDEFVFISTIADEFEAGKTIYFPVVQECEKGVHRWIEIPTTGGDSHDETSEPAPGLKLLPKR